LSYPKDVHNAVLAKLTAAQATGQPLAFVPSASLFPGIYPEIADMPPNCYPALALMPDNDQQKFFTTGDPPAKTSGFRIKVVLLVLEGKPGLGLIGDPAQTPPLVGLYDFISAVLNVLETDQTLGAAASGVQKAICAATTPSSPAFPERRAPRARSRHRRAHPASASS
jgi:hypothetical protein